MPSRSREAGLLLLATSVTLASSLALACAPRRDSGKAEPRPSGRQITAEQIESYGVRDAWEALKHGAGYLMFEEDSHGQPVRITFRGRNSIVLSSNPRIYVDGAAVDGITYLRDIPADVIRLIRVLNGVEATRIYGTGSGNGVIAITTKSG